jgi:hypothetical protein
VADLFCEGLKEASIDDKGGDAPFGDKLEEEVLSFGKATDYRTSVVIC